MTLATQNDDKNQPEELEEHEELSDEQAQSVSGGLRSIPNGDLYPTGSGNAVASENQADLV